MHTHMHHVRVIQIHACTHTHTHTTHATAAAAQDQISRQIQRAHERDFSELQLRRRSILLFELTQVFWFSMVCLFFIFSFYTRGASYLSFLDVTYVYIKYAMRCERKRGVILVGDLTKIRIDVV